MTAYAQSQPPPPTPGPSSSADEPIHVLENFVITGSNIQRIDQEKALPVTVVSREVMETREASTPVQLLSAIPQVVNVPLVENQGGSAISAPGDNSSVSLRGAGSGNTLVLLNGRRLVPHPLSSIDEGAVPSLSVNIGQLPNRGIDRIDVLRDGASSIYGTDAVAGVINYLMDRTFRGNEVTLRTTVPEAGGGFEYRGTITVGRDFSGGRGRFVTVLDYLDREAIDSRDRDYSRYLDKTAEAPPIWQTPNTGPFFASAISRDHGTQSYTFGAVNAAGVFVPSRPAYATSFTASNAANFGRFYIVPKSSGVGFKSTAASRTDPGEKVFYTNEAVSGYIQNESQRVNWFTQGEFDLTRTLTLFAEAGYYQAFSVNPYQGGNSTFTAGNPAVVYSNQPLVIAASNPWNPFGTRFYDPAGAPNADGTPRLVGTPSALLVQNAKFNGIPNSYQEVTTKVYRALAGIRGRFGDTWEWESAALYSRSTSKDRVVGDMRQSVMRDAIASGRLNPFGYTFHVVNGAVAVKEPYTNVAGDFPGLLDTRKRDGETVLKSIDFRAGGKIFELFGNAISLAAGGEYREDGYVNYVPPYSGYNPPESGLDPRASDFVGTSPAGNTDADRTVTSAYAEVLIPLATPGQKIPLANLIELSASGRTEHYSDFGQTTKPKVSLNWRPVPWVMVRGSYNQGFRAPNLSVLYSADLPRQRTIADPYRQPVTNNLPIDNSSRPFTLLANPELQPEESTGKTVGVVVDIPAVKGLSFSADYWEIKQSGVIVSPFDSLPQDDYIALAAATQAQLASGKTIDQVDLGSGTDNYQGAYGMVRLPVTDEDRAYFAAYNATRSPANQLGVVGAMSRLFSQYVNRSEGFLSGYDFGLAYQLPAFSWGRVTAATDWAYTKDLYYIGQPGDPIDEVRYDNPRLRGNINLAWRRGGWGAGFAGYYIGHYLSTSAFLTASQYADPGAESSRRYLQGVEDNGVTTYRYIVDELWTFNAFVSYRVRQSPNAWLKNTRFRLGVANLTDEVPPLIGAGYSRTVNSNVLAGRTWSFEVAKDF